MQPHPPWQKGHFVSYLLQRDDGSWAGFTLRVVAREEGAWVLQVLYRTERVDGVVHFRCPDDPGDGPADVPFHMQVLRGEPEMMEQPIAIATMVMNLLLVRRWPGLEQILAGPAEAAVYPCGIFEVRTLVGDAVGYKKHHALSPRVPITGVAGMSIDGVRNPIAVVAHGLSDDGAPIGFDDHVDTTSPRVSHHGGFTLSYPATWVLLPQQVTEPVKQRLVARLGGNACAAILVVELAQAEEPLLAAYRRQLVDGFRSNPALQLRHALDPDREPVIRLADMRGPGIWGLAHDQVHRSGDRLLYLHLFGCILRDSPRRDAVLAEFERLFGAIHGSLAFAEGPHA